MSGMMLNLAIPSRAAAAGLLIALLRSAFAQAPNPQAERTLFELTNRVRAEHHLPPLFWDPALAIAARNHALRILGERSSLEHQYPGEPALVSRAAAAGARFTTISENLARGRTSPAAIEQLWMSTPVHRANLLNPQLDTLGIGVLEDNGTLIAVQDFTTAGPSLRQDDLEARVMQLLRDHGLASVVSSTAARTVCQQHATTAPSARLIVQWEGDTSQLPDVLLQQLRQSRFTGAAVGACTPASQAPGFASGRVAVLLF